MSPYYSLLGICLVVSLLLGANSAAASLGDHTWKVAVFVHVLGWAAQFYAHDKFEGRQPALFTSLFQSLMMAPLFVCMEVAMAFGMFQDFHAKVEKGKKQF